MCDYATAADERFGLSRIEIDREGPSYTADTLRELRERSPEDELVLILGGDQAAALPTLARAGRGDAAGDDRGRRARRGGPRARRGRRSAGRLSSGSSTCRVSTCRPQWCASGRPRGSRSATSCPTRSRTSSARRASTARRSHPDGRDSPSTRHAGAGGAREPDRGDRGRQEGRRRPHPRPARDRRLHGLLRDLLGQHRAADEGDPRRGSTRS